jgi:hypothetical protein
MTKKTMNDLSRFTLKIAEIFMSVTIFSFSLLFLSFLTGCARSDLPQDHEYEFKQIRGENFETSYMACKKCPEHTKINKFKN